MPPRHKQQWGAIFWIIALLPAVGIAVWLALSRNQTVGARTQPS
jgi:hypothetical protein